MLQSTCVSLNVSVALQRHKQPVVRVGGVCSNMSGLPGILAAVSPDLGEDYRVVFRFPRAFLGSGGVQNKVVI